MKEPYHNELIPSSLFSEDDYQRLMLRLWDLLATQTKKYTMGESTSITEKTAHELLSSLWYTLTLALEDTNSTYSRLLTDELWPMVKRGQEILNTNLIEAKKLLEAVCKTAPDIENFYYTDTLRGIKDYFKQYDLFFFAHQKPPCIDYPLLVNPQESIQGISYTQQYLKNMLIENLLLNRFEPSILIKLLKAVAPDYREFYMNLCEQPLTNALGLTLLGKYSRTLCLDDNEQHQIETLLQNESYHNRQKLLRTAANSLCEEFQITDSQIKNYLTEFSDNLFPRFNVALSSGNLSHIFVKVCN